VLMSVTFRAATPFDLPELVQLYRSAELAEIGRAETTAPDITDLLHAPGLDLVRRSRVAAIEGELRGLVMLHPAPQPGQQRLQLCVSPHPRSRQLAAALLELAGTWVGQDCPGGTDVTLFQLPGSLAAPELTAAGWQIVHRGRCGTGAAPGTHSTTGWRVGRIAGMRVIGAVDQWRRSYPAVPGAVSGRRAS